MVSANNLKAQITNKIGSSIFYIQSDQITAKVQPYPAKLQKVMDLTMQLQPYVEVIMNSEYYKEEKRRLRKMPGINN